MKNFNDIKDYCRDLKSDYPKLSDFEVLSLAVQMQRNDILRTGLTVFQSDDNPPALEAIAIQLGFAPQGGRGYLPGTILSELSDIKDLLEKIAEKE